MRLPDDVFSGPLEYQAYFGTYRVGDFMRSTNELTRNVVVCCLLKQIDIANKELARLRVIESELIGLDSQVVD